MKRLITASLLALCASAAAHAATPGLYVGAGVSQAKLNNIGKDFNLGSIHDFHLHNTAWKAILGVRPVKYLGVEANYDDLGDEHRDLGLGAHFNADAKAYTGYLVGYLPLPLPILDVYGKAGIAHWKTRASATGAPGFAFDDTGNDFAWGAGVQAHFGGLAGRLEYERFDVPHSDGVELLTLGVTFTLF